MPAVPNTRHATIEPLEKRTLFATPQVAGLTESIVVQNQLSNPTAMEFAPDGRLFVTQQGGQLRVIKNGALLSTPFLTVSPIDSSGERGLLGIAFDPNFATNRFLYVYHTVTGPTHNRVTRFTADPNNPDVVLAGSGVPILDLDNLSGATNHNGGGIHFGTDGKLYVAVGENANPANAQVLTNRLGKMLRINPDGSIPTDNPFFNTAAGANRAIWALGLRNPYTFAVQPGTGTIYINDVGQSAWEEIDLGTAGANYGWNRIEGERTTQSDQFTFGTYSDPLLAYPHTGPDPNHRGTAITGGTFYNPPVPQFAADFVGDYFYADLGAGWIRKYDPGTDTSSLFATGGSTIVDLKTGPDGSLHFLERGSGSNTGTVRRIRANVASPSAPDLAAASDSGASDTDNVTNNNMPTFTGTAPGAATVRIVMDGTTVVGTATPAAGGAFSVTTSVVPDGAHRFTAVATNAGGLTSDPSAAVTVTVDTVRPTLTAASFDYQTGPHKLRYTFSEDVRGSLQADDASVDNPLLGAPPFPAHNVAYVPATNTAVFTFDNFPGGLLPNGNYRAFLAADGVADLAGNTVSVPGGGGFLFEFFVLNGDVNRDRSVNGSDFAILAGNFGKTGQAYDAGDLNGDGNVNGSDFALLAGNFGQTVPPPPPAVTLGSASVSAGEASGPSARKAAKAAHARPRALRRALRLGRTLGRP